MINKLALLILFLFILGGLGLLYANRNVEKKVSRGRWIKYWVYIGIVYSILIAGILGRPAYFSLIVILVTAGLFEILKNLWSSGKLAEGAAKPVLLITGYSVVSVFACLNCFRILPETFIFIYVLVAGFEGFSQVSGQMFGKTKLSPRISPNKTIEGFIGGLIVCICLALLLGDNSKSGWAGLYFLVGLYIGVTALIGDLLASGIKRWMKIKDFSRLLPGHGGILDRFDGFIFVLACMLPLPYVLMKG